MLADDVHIRLLGPDDWQLHQAVRLQALRDSPDAFWATYDDEAGRDESRLRARLDPARDGGTWVAESAGVAVGLVTTYVDPASDTQDPDGTAHLVSLWVRPEWRGRGVASALVEAVVGWARHRGLRRVSLWVVDSNDAARRLYARHGFRETGRVGAFPEPRTHLAEHEEELLLG